MEELEKNRILFAKPDLKQMNEKYYAVDMHFHSKYSDGINKIPSILRHAKKLGIGIAITDHNAIKGAIEACNQSEVLVIPGIEITSKEGPHVLLYFYEANELERYYNDHIKSKLGKSVMFPTKISVNEIIKTSKQYNCLSVFAHPYSFGTTGIYTKFFKGTKRDALINSVDTFEVINSENLHSWNLMSGVKAYNLNKNMIGGSDGHTLYHMGKVVTYSKLLDKNEQKISKKELRKEFLDSIKNNKSRVVGKDIDLLRKFIATTYKIKPNLRKLPRAFLQLIVVRIPSFCKTKRE